MKKNENRTKFEALASTETSNWEEEALKRQAEHAWRSKSEAIALLILRNLRRLGISQKDLAERVGVSPQYINKVVKGSENLSLETISKIEQALGISLIEVDFGDQTSSQNQEYVPFVAIHYFKGERTMNLKTSHSAKFSKDLNRVSA